MLKFRTFLSVLLTAALFIGSVSMMAVAAPSDINGDGLVNTPDARTLLLSLSGTLTLTEEQRLAADVNGDGRINTGDVRVLLSAILQPAATTTQPTTVTTALSSTTLPPTTTTTWVLTGPEGTAPTTVPPTTDTTMPDCVSTFISTYPTTLPYGGFTVSAESVTVRGGDTVTVPIKISREHALVGFEMEIQYHPELLQLQEVSDDGRNPYATDLNPAVFNDNAQWRFTKIRDGILNVRYVSSADNGPLDSGSLFTLTFKAAEFSVERTAYIGCSMLSYLCCAGDMEYIPTCNTSDGAVTIIPVTTLYPTTATTYLIEAPTTLPYGDALCFTGETATVRVGDTFAWSVDVSARHSLVGLEMDIYYDPDVLMWIPDETTLSGAIFNSDTRCRIADLGDGHLRLLYVSGADTGDAVGGELFTFTFQLLPDIDVDIDDTWIYLSPTSTLSAVNGYAYYANSGTITNGHIKVASRSTRPKTTTTTGESTTTTYPPTTTTFVYAG